MISPYIWDIGMNFSSGIIAWYLMPNQHSTALCKDPLVLVLPQWAKIQKSPIALEIRLFKSTYLEIFFDVDCQGSKDWENFSKNIDSSLWGNHSKRAKQLHILLLHFFLFLAHCDTDRSYGVNHLFSSFFPLLGGWWCIVG